MRVELESALKELRELARGIHPAILSHQGLACALDELAARSPVPAELVALPAQRLPEPIEAAAYYVVAEALTNVAKHAQALARDDRRHARGRAHHDRRAATTAAAEPSSTPAPACAGWPIGSRRWAAASG